MGIRYDAYAFDGDQTQQDGDEVSYVGRYVQRAHRFASDLAAEGRGMVYTIG